MGCIMFDDKYFMGQALKEASKAYKKNEIPVGAVIVENNKIIARGYNKKDSTGIVNKHAEMVAIEKANKKKKDWRLNDCTIYVTLEPCPMCASAIQQSRMSRVVYGCSSNNSLNSKIIREIFNSDNSNNQIQIKSGVLSDECSCILKQFFSLKR